MMVKDSGSVHETRPFWLVQGMGRVLGVNLSAALATGALKRADLDDMVVRCAACGREADCLPWLGSQTGQAEALPDYCAVKTALEALRRRMPGGAGDSSPAAF